MWLYMFAIPMVVIGILLSIFGVAPVGIGLIVLGLVVGIARGSGFLEKTRSEVGTRGPEDDPSRDRDLHDAKGPAHGGQAHMTP